MGYPPYSFPIHITVHNAQPLVDAGASHVVQDGDDKSTANEVGNLLFDTFMDSHSLQAMADALTRQARPEAAETVLSVLLKR